MTLDHSNNGLQWGSEIWTSLDFLWSKRGCVAKGLDFEWDLKSRSTTPEIRTIGCHFVKNHLKSGQKCPDSECSSFRMVGIAIAIAKAQPFENRTIWNLTFKNFGFQMFPHFKWSHFRSQLYSADGPISRPGIWPTPELLTCKRCCDIGGFFKKDIGRPRHWRPSDFGGLQLKNN